MKDGFLLNKIEILLGLNLVWNKGSPVIFHSWGACAEECRKRVCDHWTWASSTCTNCSPNNCILFTSSGEEQTLEAPGHISGRKDCSDISFVDPERSVQRHNDTENLEFSVGQCQTSSSIRTGSRSPKCLGQEVPGYRWAITNYVCFYI